jgi:hypothetical protein
MFTHELFKPSIWLEEDVLAPASGISLGKDSPTPTPGTLSGKDGTTSTSEANLGTSAEPIGQAQEPGGEIVTVVGPPSLDADWQEPIFEYLRLGTILDNETETQHLARRAKGYLIHNDELYHHITSGILQWCIPTEEGKAQVLNVHELVCKYNASSRSMVGKAF